VPNLVEIPQFTVELKLLSVSENRRLPYLIFTSVLILTIPSSLGCHAAFVFQIPFEKDDRRPNYDVICIFQDASRPPFWTWYKI